MKNLIKKLLKRVKKLNNNNTIQHPAGTNYLTGDKNISDFVIPRDFDKPSKSIIENFKEAIGN